ncbi:hypothetical protein ACFLZH_05505 [Patescibacteria group bacterium]
MKESPASSFDPEAHEQMRSIFEQIEALTFRTNNPDEIKEALQALPDFDIGSLSLDGEIYFALAMKYLGAGEPQEDHYEMDHPEGIQEFTEDVEIHRSSTAKLIKTILSLGESVDLTYFQSQPKGETFQRLRSVRTSKMGLALGKLA